MITVTILPAIFIILHTILLIRFFVDLFFQTDDRHYSFSWFLFIVLVPLVGYYNYYRRHGIKTKS